ncbi:MAG: hypothetical protein OEY51_09405, partial [Cyclobacteriaceae bacterium]|nr:hypothetical protein [Cyclobacteriaceae bacterium]
FQVKFSLDHYFPYNIYGYLLVDSGTSLKKVVHLILERLTYFSRMTSMGYYPIPTRYNDIIIFKNGNN